MARLIEWSTRSRSVWGSISSSRDLTYKWIKTTLQKKDHERENQEDVISEAQTTMTSSAWTDVQFDEGQVVLMKMYQKNVVDG